MAAECIYCHRRAARPRKRTNDYKCDHCDKTFGADDLEDYRGKLVEKTASEWRQQVVQRHARRLLSAATALLAREAERAPKPPSGEGVMPLLLAVLVAGGLAYGVNLGLAGTQSSPLVPSDYLATPDGSVPTAVWAIAAGIGSFFVVRAVLNVAIGERHRWLRAHADVYPAAEVAQPTTDIEALAAVCDRFADQEMIAALQSWGDGIVVPRGAVAAAVFGDGGPDEALSLDLDVPGWTGPKDPFAMDLHVRELAEKLFAQTVDRLNAAGLAGTPVAKLFALASSGYEIEPELVPPPAAGRDVNGIQKAFEDLLPEEQVRAMRSHRIAVIAISAGALSFGSRLLKISGDPVSPAVTQLLVDAVLRKRAREVPKEEG